MAWRPYENLIDGELDNRSPGKVTGWMRFFRDGRSPLRVTFDLAGDFHEDIRGKVIRLSNPQPADRNGSLDRRDTYMEGFASVQRGEVGDMTAGLSLGPWTEELAQKLMAQNELIWDDLGLKGVKRERRRREFPQSYRENIEASILYYPYVEYPYIEWYSEANGRVVLELDPSQVEILDAVVLPAEKAPQEMLQDEKRRERAMTRFLGEMAQGLSRRGQQNDRAR